MPAAARSRQLTATATAPKPERPAGAGRALQERMMGLEPTTFAMARRALAAN